MSKAFAIILLLVYSCFSSFAVASNYVHAEASSEGTEKEVVTNNFPEHREVVSLRFADKKQSPQVQNNFFYEDQVSEANFPLILHSPVPIYIMHCVYRL